MNGMSTKDVTLMFGKPLDYIKTHRFGFWHKYVNGVNMSYIDCSYNLTVDNVLPKFENRFTMYARPSDDVNSISFLI